MKKVEYNRNEISLNEMKIALERRADIQKERDERTEQLQFSFIKLFNDTVDELENINATVREFNLYISFLEKELAKQMNALPIKKI